MEDLDFLVVDRFVEEYAVCENGAGEMISIRKEELPENVSEGDMIVKSGDTYAIDEVRTMEKKTSIEKRMDALWE